MTTTRDINPLIANKNWERRKNFCLFLFGYKILTRSQNGNKFEYFLGTVLPDPVTDLLKSISGSGKNLIDNNNNNNNNKTVIDKMDNNNKNNNNNDDKNENVSLVYNTYKVLQNLNLCILIVSYI